MNAASINVFIIGLGQIGGSIGLDLVGCPFVSEVVGYDLDDSVSKLAISIGAINKAASSIEDGIKNADVILLATPIRKTIDLIPKVCELSSERQIILDVASTKTEILNTAERHKGKVNYISCHPIAGSEGFGINSAEKGKFKGKSIILIPSNSTQTKWLNLVTKIIQALGARQVIMDAEEHDKLITITINLPYLFSLCLMKLAGDTSKYHKDIWKLVGGSFLGATRVASSSSELILDLFLTNKKQVSNVIDEIVDELSNLKTMILRQDESKMEGLFKTVRHYREIVNENSLQDNE
jgi:prephenate dehydrogenase